MKETILNLNQICSMALLKLLGAAATDLQQQTPSCAFPRRLQKRSRVSLEAILSAAYYTNRLCPSLTTIVYHNG
jgi:hypothetical protein